MSGSLFYLYMLNFCPVTNRLKLYPFNNSIPMRRPVLSFVFVFMAILSYAQKPMSIKMKNPVICYAAAKDNPLHVLPPEEYVRWKNNAGARQQGATIIVDYIGFPDNVNGVGAKAAFQAAVDIW